MNTRRLLLMVLALGAACLFLAALVFAASFVFLSAQSNARATSAASAWREPTKIDTLKIAPALSVATLAGTTDAAAVSNMLARGEVDSAYTASIFSTNLSDRQRLGELLAVADRYTAADNAAGATRTDQAVMDIVVLSPSLSDYERAEALAQTANGLYRLKETTLARSAIDAGREVAMQSPFLKEAHRFALLGKLLLAAQTGKDDTRIRALNEVRASLVDVNDAGSVPPSEVADPLPSVETPPASDALTKAMTNRVAAAKKVTQLTDTGTDVPTDLVDALANALFAEDDVRTRAYTSSSGQQMLAQKVALARAQVDWLTLKYRIARKGFGFSLMPEWEDAEGEIRTQLAKAYENFFALRDEQVVALPQARDVDLARSYLLRQQLLAGRFGLY
ncbi:MAG: hypothetical protein LC737_03510, partial [Chloroflexi bacterium]|nr:hypothetical protein [Chloroflexota bacterium]